MDLYKTSKSNLTAAEHVRNLWSLSLTEHWAELALQTVSLRAHKRTWEQPVQKLFKPRWKSSYSVALTPTILYPLKYMMLWQATLDILDVIVLTFKEKTSLKLFWYLDKNYYIWLACFPLIVHQSYSNYVYFVTGKYINYAPTINL